MCLSSCALTKQERKDKRNSKKLEQIFEESPDLISTKVDTVYDTIKVSQEIKLEADTLAFDSLLEKYLDLNDAHAILHFKATNMEVDLHQKRFLAQKIQELKRKLREGAYIPTQKFHLEDSGKFEIDFVYDRGKFTWNGEVYNNHIHTKSTITLKEFINKEPTFWQAAKKLSVFIIILLLAIVGLLFLKR